MKGLTDWKRVDALTDEDIERAVASDPDTWFPTDEEWANARLVWPSRKEPVTIRIDRDVYNWFRKGDPAFENAIHHVLADYIAAQKPRRKSKPRPGAKKASRAVVKKSSAPKLTKGLRRSYR